MGNNKWKEFEVNSWLEPNEAYLMINDCEKERDKLILRTMWETAGRVTEVLSLIPKHIDVINNSIDLPNLKQLGIKKKYSETDEEYSIRKAEHKQVLDNRYSLICQTKGPLLDTKSAPLKTIYLFPESTLCNDLLEYAKKEKIEKEQWLFKGFSKSGRVSSSYIWRLLSDKTPNRKQGLAVEHQIIKKKTTDKTYAWPHLFRHGAAMYILKRVGRLDIVQQQLGHSTILTTEGYAKATNDDRREVIQTNMLEESKISLVSKFIESARGGIFYEEDIENFPDLKTELNLLNDCFLPSGIDDTAYRNFSDILTIAYLISSNSVILTISETISENNTKTIVHNKLHHSGETQDVVNQFPLAKEIVFGRISWDAVIDDNIFLEVGCCRVSKVFDALEKDNILYIIPEIPGKIYKFIRGKNWDIYLELKKLKHEKTKENYNKIFNKSLK